MPFDGRSYDRERDSGRLWSALSATRHLMIDGQWRTLKKIREALFDGYNKAVSEAGISARLRDLRKDKFGALTLESRHVYEGLWEYRLVMPLQAELDLRE